MTKKHSTSLNYWEVLCPVCYSDQLRWGIHEGFVIDFIDCVACDRNRFTFNACRQAYRDYKDIVEREQIEAEEEQANHPFGWENQRL